MRPRITTYVHALRKNDSALLFYMFLLHGKLMPGMEKWLGKLLIPEGKLLIPREKVVFRAKRGKTFSRGIKSLPEGIKSA